MYESGASVGMLQLANFMRSASGFFHKKSTKDEFLMRAYGHNAYCQTLAELSVTVTYKVRS